MDFFDKQWKNQPQYYDELGQMVFDEEGSDIDKKKPDEREETPDYYDANADNHDEIWIYNNINKHLGINRKTDAFLNCPCCFSLLCIDCQRHENILNQYRAVFVQNCITRKDRELKYRKEPEVSHRQLKKQVLRAKRLAKKRQLKGEENIEQVQEIPTTQSRRSEKPFEYCDNILVEDEDLYEPEIFFPVHCSECDVQVAVMDQEEVYHFFNVAPSES